MLRIIHISDFHLENENPNLRKQNIIKALSKDLENYVANDTILFFTGDLLNQGAAGFKNKDNAFKTFEEIFINPILEENPKLKGSFFIIPGNHDIFRDKIDKYSEIGLNSELKNADSLDSFIRNNRNESTNLSRIEDYKKWENDFYQRNNDKASSLFEFSHKIEIEDGRIGITCLNSAWFCKDDKDKGNILLGRNQIENSLDELGDCEVRLLLSHHPLEFFKEFDREKTWPLIHHKYDAFFTGHVHKLASTYTQDLDGNVFISIANSTIADDPKEREYINGYTIVDLYPNKKLKFRT